ncbi:general substrate transporter [Penicillium sp. DV-2018c]|nr:general substrate transporter [Penicillium sp. DV-2018c]
MEKDSETSHIESNYDQKTPVKDGAGHAVQSERHMGFREAIRLYPMAVVWSVGLSMAVVMEGYAVMLLSSFYALPQFNRKYGQLQPDGTYVIPAPWRSALSNGAVIGEIIGLFLTGIVQDRFGYRLTIFGALCLVTGFIFILFFAQNVEMLLAGEILCGIYHGAPFKPSLLRTPQRPDQWAYRIPFAVQWAWPIPLMIMCLLAPESPWWLVRHGRQEAARHSLVRLMSRSNNMVDETLAMIEHTDHIEKEASAGTSYWECFKRSNLRRTEIVSLVWLIQIICGSQLMGYSTVFYIAAGLTARSSFNMSLIQYGLGAIGTRLSWFLITRVGRRTLYLYGNLALFGLLLIIGFVSLAPRDTTTNWVIGALLSVFTFTYDLMVGLSVTHSYQSSRRHDYAQSP